MVLGEWSPLAWLWLLRVRQFVYQNLPVEPCPFPRFIAQLGLLLLGRLGIFLPNPG